MIKYTKTISLDRLIKNHFDFNRINGYCKECPNYGNLWSCPPFDFDVNVVFNGRSHIKINAWVFNTEELKDSEIEHLNSNTVYEMNYLVLEEEKKTPGSFAFYADSCDICGDGYCSRLSNMPCLHLNKMRYTLEAFGVDVLTLLEDLFDLKLVWADEGKKYPNQIVRVTGLIE
ncbi:MAG TPA: DUF2284 domain-containing protein [Anaerovoracaceae bacterium]|nr:DUF2284 domain-containing protein [Anaerovoracaceae bacterium]